LVGRRNQPGQAAKKTTRPSKLSGTPNTAELEAGVVHMVPNNSNSFDLDPVFQFRGTTDGSFATLDEDRNMPRLRGVVRAWLEDNSENNKPYPFNDPVKLARLQNKKTGIKHCKVIDGFHRAEALRRENVTTIAVKIEDMSGKEATQRAAKANQMHGLPASPKENANTIKRLIEGGAVWKKDGSLMTLREIANDLMGGTLTEQTMRNTVKRVAPDFYRRHYGRDAQPIQAGEGKRAKREEYDNEARAIFDALRLLVDRMSRDSDRWHREESAATIGKLLDETREKLAEIQFGEDEFSRPLDLNTDQDEDTEQPF